MGQGFDYEGSALTSSPSHQAHDRMPERPIVDAAGFS